MLCESISGFVHFVKRNIEFDFQDHPHQSKQRAEQLSEKEKSRQLKLCFVNQISIMQIENFCAKVVNNQTCVGIAKDFKHAYDEKL